MDINKLKKAASPILGFIIIGCIVYGLYWVGINLIGILVILKPEVIAAIIGAMATVLVGLSAVIISSKQSKQRDIDESHRAKKVEMYEGFLEAVSGIMAKTNKNVSKKGLSDQELVDYLVEFKTDLLLWGSPKVIKYFLEFNKLASKPDKVFTAVDNLYKAIREDIGLSNRGLDGHELVKMYLTDPEELDVMIASQQEET